MYSPSFTKPTHGYGTPFPQQSPQDELFSVVNSPEQEENWAGEGFDLPYEEP